MTDADAPSPARLADLLLQVHEQSCLMVALFDARDVLLYANKSYRQAFDVAPDESPTWADIMRHGHAHGLGAAIETDDIEAWLASACSRRGAAPYRAFETDLCDGRRVWVTETTQVHGALLFIASDISDLRRSNRDSRQAHVKTRADAHTDAMTGLSKRHHGLRLLQASLSQSEIWPMCVAMFDLDLFQQINDGFGHEAGNTVICDFARLLQAGSRREDGCARTGGDKFCLILPTAGLAQAQSIVERLLASVRLSRPLPAYAEHGYTCSAGLAQAVWGDSAEALLKRADAALYQAKAAGRDRCVIAM